MVIGCIYTFIFKNSICNDKKTKYKVVEKKQGAERRTEKAASGEFQQKIIGLKPFFWPAAL